MHKNMDLEERFDLSTKRQRKVSNKYEDLLPRRSNSLGMDQVRRSGQVPAPNPHARSSSDDASQHYEDVELPKLDNLISGSPSCRHTVGHFGIRPVLRPERSSVTGASDNVNYMAMGKRSSSSSIFESIQINNTKMEASTEGDFSRSSEDSLASQNIYDMLYTRKMTALSNSDIKSTLDTPTVFYTMELLMVRLIHGCISELPFRVDCIVNPTNAILNCKSPASHTLMRAAGPNFEQACIKAVGYTGGFRVTECCATEPGDLKCNTVINAVCPTKKHGRDKVELKELVYCTFVNCFRKANEMRATTVAVPSISLDCFDTSHEFARVFVDAVLEFSRTYPEGERYLKTIYFADVSSKDTFAAIASLCNEAFATNSSGLFLPKKMDMSGSDVTDDEKMARDQKLSASYRVAPGDAFSKSNPAIYDPETGNIKVLIYTHDIRDVKTEAVVCPENRLSPNGGRTAMSIHQTFRISMRSTKLDKIRKGGYGRRSNSVVTTVGKEEYPPRYILHEVFPVWKHDEEDPVEFEESLSSSIRTFFESLKNKKKTKAEISSVALPILGISNLCHSPVSKCCNIMAGVVKETCLDANKRPASLKEVHIICQCREMAQAMDGYFQQILK